MPALLDSPNSLAPAGAAGTADLDELPPSVGFFVGMSVGAAVGVAVGAVVGASVGAALLESLDGDDELEHPAAARATPVILTAISALRLVMINSVCPCQALPRR